MKTNFTLLLSVFSLCFTGPVVAQLQLPDGGVNLKRSTGTRVGVTDINIEWSAPGVKGREGNIWGTGVAHYGFIALGFGSNVPSPWRAGADENTTIQFSTDVTINGKKLAAGKYGFHIALYTDSCTLIFNRNTQGWGSYFYNANLDVLRVTARQQKGLKESRERLDYIFSNHKENSVEVALEWERWRIPFTVAVDLTRTTLASVQAQMSGALGFDPPSLEAAAAWCLRNEVNLEQAMNWITSATDPTLGGRDSFTAMSTKSGLLRKLNRQAEADEAMKIALENASPLELHQYGRQLLSDNKPKEAFVIFEKNFKKNKGVWPTQVGMMRGYSALGDLKKALEHARFALAQAPSDLNKQTLEQAIKTLESGKPL